MSAEFSVKWGQMRKKKKTRERGWMKSSQSERDQAERRQKNVCLVGDHLAGGLWGGSLGKDQGHCVFHQTRSATKTPSPSVFLRH